MSDYHKPTDDALNSALSAGGPGGFDKCARDIVVTVLIAREAGIMMGAGLESQEKWLKRIVEESHAAAIESGIAKGLLDG